MFSEMTPDRQLESEFNQWYDTEHIPVRMACPGFVSAQRYKSIESDSYLAVYELTDAAALSTPEYKLVKDSPSDLTRRMLSSVSGFTRYLAEQASVRLQDGTDVAPGLDAPILYAVWFDVPEEARAEFDDWYDSEHVPLLMGCAEWLMVRRFHVAEGVPKSYTHLALHYLQSEHALESPAREAARATEWRSRLAAAEWFKPSYSVFGRHGRRQIAKG